MKLVSSLEDIKKEILSKKALIFYFSSKSCSVCSVLKPKIEKEILKNFDKIDFIEIKSDENPELTSYFGVFSAPVILFYLDGKEFLREGKNVSVGALMDSIRRPYEMFYGK